MDFERVVGRQKKDDLRKREMTSIKLSVGEFEKTGLHLPACLRHRTCFFELFKAVLVNGVEERFFGLLDLQLIG
jgi:hypothetical protein